MKIFVSGGELIAKGALDAGVRFFAGYPITPASVIYEPIMRELPKVGGVSVGASDEISAISYCIGASLMGIKSMTATSGPGFSLMIESVSFALMSEIPVTIVLAQRLGPATGGATTTSQGDLLLAAFSNSGGYPIPIVSPSTIEESYEFIVHAVNISEVLRTPSIFLTEKEVTMTRKSVDLSSLKKPEILERKIYKGDGEFKTYNFKTLEDVPLFSPVGGKYLTRYTGSAHDKKGDLKKDDPEVLEVLYHLKEKIIKNIHKFFFYEYVERGSDILLLSYGITSESVREVSEEKNLSYLILKTLYPLEEEIIKSIFERYKKIVVIEENIIGSLYILIRHLLDNKGYSLTKIGSLISPFEIKKFLNSL
ncbi:MAG: pyruvate flavodoxin/ferredoxin oxidoreductase [Candidatus Hydrothermales bacterium]